METLTLMGNLIQVQIEEVRPFQHVTKQYSVSTGSSLRSCGREASCAARLGITAGSARPFLTILNAGTD